MRIKLSSGFPVGKREEVLNTFAEAGLPLDGVSQLLGYPIESKGSKLLDDNYFKSSMRKAKERFIEGDDVFLDFEQHDTSGNVVYFLKDEMQELVDKIVDEFPTINIGTYGPFTSKAWPPFLTKQTLYNAHKVMEIPELSTFHIPLYCSHQSSDKTHWLDDSTQSRVDFIQRLVSCICYAKTISKGKPIGAFFQPILRWPGNENNLDELEDNTIADWFSTVYLLGVEEVIWWEGWERSSTTYEESIKRIKRIAPIIKESIERVAIV